MRKLIVSDIFGRTEALENLALKLAAQVEIFDAYDAEKMGFKDEAQAYDYFSSKLGLEKYTLILTRFLKSNVEPIQLIGFSVGATAIWRLSDNSALKHISGAVVFYGSQIRNHKDINPLFPIKLIFPHQEQHFSVTELIADLIEKDKVTIEHVNFQHGFMNCHSNNFDQLGFKQYLQTL
jgi:dienelactone hydrolase